MAAPQGFLTVKEAIKRLCISPSTFWKYVGLGEINTVKYFGNTLVKETEVARILNSLKNC